MKKFFALSAIRIFLVLSVYPQPLPIKYGKIDTLQLKLKTYEKDPTVSAVVLCDLGIFDPNTFTFWRHLRIKILKKEGAWFVNQIVNTPTKSTIKGCTYNYVDGKIKESRLRDESIFREHVRVNLERFRVTMPDVIDGSIVELYYSFQGLPMEWHFQHIIPVEWSELRIPDSRFLTFNKVFFGFHPLAVNHPNQWIAKDVPALKEEPFMNSMTNYLTRFEIELSDVSFPGLYLNFTTSWDDVNRKLLENEYFGVQLNDMAFYLNEVAKNIQKVSPTPEYKLLAAYNYVKRQVKWTDECSLFTRGQLSEANKNHAGNSAEVNLILIKLLKKLDFEVYPVALSTRDNGIISHSFPTIQKLNYVIALVFLNKTPVFLDATEEELPLGFLPERCLNGQGRIIHETKSGWIDLPADKKSKTAVYANYTITPDLEIKGTVDYALHEFAALNFREEYKKFTSPEEYVADQESKSPGLTISNLSIQNLDSLNLPVNVKHETSIGNRIDDLGAVISMNPLLFNRMTTSPFKEKERKFPVDFAFPIEERITVQFSIPEGYIISEIPEAMNLVLPEKKGAYRYQVIATQNLVKLITKLTIDEVVFTESEYEILREFYNQIITKQAETIILRKADS